VRGLLAGQAGTCFLRAGDFESVCGDSDAYNFRLIDLFNRGFSKKPLPEFIVVGCWSESQKDGGALPETDSFWCSLCSHQPFALTKRLRAYDKKTKLRLSLTQRTPGQAPPRQCGRRNVLGGAYRDDTNIRSNDKNYEGRDGAGGRGELASKGSLRARPVLRGTRSWHLVTPACPVPRPTGLTPLTGRLSWLHLLLNIEHPGRNVVKGPIARHPDQLLAFHGSGDEQVSKLRPSSHLQVCRDLRVGCFAGLYVTWRTFDLNREGQVTDRFTRAIDHLGKDQLEVRLGGIYALERIARDSERDHGPVMEVLNAFVRSHTPWPAKDGNQSSSLGKSKHRPSPDVQAALRVIGRRDPDRDDRSVQLRFSDADLRGASLRGGHFEGARFRRAHLEGARLEGVHLQRAKLRDADFSGADFGPDRELGLEGANLEGAHLEGANFEAAKLRGAHLNGAFYDKNTRWPEGLNPKREGLVASTGTTREQPG
jgi:hypothetical protein